MGAGHWLRWLPGFEGLAEAVDQEVELDWQTQAKAVLNHPGGREKSHNSWVSHEKQLQSRNKQRGYKLGVSR